MNALAQDALRRYRDQTFRTARGSRLTSQDEAIAYVNERGFVYFWPIKGITLPSLWVAVAGDRPVADAHDDPGHVTWGWKDNLIDKHVWYYAKVLRQRATMISLGVAPYFYALTENYGAPEEDYLVLYQQGRMTLEAKLVYEALLDKGALDTVALRKAAHMTSSESDSRFNKALSDLQSSFMIVPVAVTQAGAWRYSFAYDLVTRHYPEVEEAARFIGEHQARQKLAGIYLRSVGAAQLRDVTRLFGWSLDDARRAISDLLKTGEIKECAQLEGQPGHWYIINSLIGC